MPFQIIHQDITKMQTDAIVNAANTRLLEGGGVCGAIFAAAGRKKLQAECDTKAPCPVGKAVITKGYQLSSKYVIHTVGPVWHGGDQGEAALLCSAYKSALDLAEANQCESIAFPLISSGIYGYPKEEALKLAVETIKTFLESHEMMVYLVVFERQMVSLSKQLEGKIAHYIDIYYEEKMDTTIEEEFSYPIKRSKVEKKETRADAKRKNREEIATFEEREDYYEVQSAPIPMEILLKEMAESFSDYLLRLIDEKGFTDVAVYKRANMDRKLFSKIRSQKAYHPKKQTVISLAIALELDRKETEALLQKAGYSLSNSYKFDVIISYFLEQREYDIFKINEALFYFGETLLGT